MKAKSDRPPAAIVTGASRGLGRGIACSLSAEGCSIVINYAGNAAAATETARQCEQVKRNDAQRFVPVQADIGSTTDREGLVGTAIEECGGVDILVNNAGVAPRIRSDIVEATESSFDEVMRTNLAGPYFLSQAVARYWLEPTFVSPLPNGPKLIFITSISAHTASVSRGEYCISKAGLAMAAQLWAVRLAEAGIQVFEIRPGIMETDMTSAVKDKYDRLIAEGLVPEKRWGTPEDVGRVTAACVRGDLPFATGSIIDVDGGFHLRRL